MHSEIIVKELARVDRAALESHFLALVADDRRLRFGALLNDGAIRTYLGRIDFERDAVFGVLDDELALIGVAHVARSNRHAELGISVWSRHRGHGIGAKLLERAHTRARNWGVRALFMHCLSENSAMMHLARKQGMRIEATSGEADAWLTLPPANASSHFGEVFAQRVALLDAAFKTQLVNARRVADAITPGRPLPARER
jgi:RimJ/RimL family protein N-acetyltransferase